MFNYFRRSQTAVQQTPYHLASFPNVHKQRGASALVNAFLHHAFPRAPTAIPPNEPWEISAANVQSMLVDSGARTCRLDMQGPILLALGEGVWLADGQSSGGSDSRGKRLWIAPPTLPSAAGLTLKGEDGLPATVWESHELLMNVTLNFTNRKYVQAPLVSLFTVKPLGVDGKPLLINEGDGHLPRGIVVAFIVDPQRRTRRRDQLDGLNREYRPPRVKGQGLSAAITALITAMLSVMDVDGAAMAGWTAAFIDGKHRTLQVKHVDVLNGSWLILGSHTLRSAFYGLPEGPGRPHKIPFSFAEVDKSGATKTRKESVVVDFNRKELSTAGLVTAVIWSVHPSPDQSDTPRGLGLLCEIVFSNGPSRAGTW